MQNYRWVVRLHAATSVHFAFDEVGLLHRENAVLAGQIDAEIPREVTEREVCCH